MNLLEKEEWLFYNVNMKGDEEEKVAFIGKGETVIDDILAGERIKKRMDKVVVGNEISLEHFPTIVTLKYSGWNRHIVKKEETGKEK